MADLEADDVFGTGTPLDKLCDELANMYPPTNDWKKLTEERLISFRNKTKQQKKKRAEFKQKSRM